MPADNHHAAVNPELAAHPMGLASLAETAAGVLARQLASACHHSWAGTASAEREQKPGSLRALGSPQVGSRQVQVLAAP